MKDSIKCLMKAESSNRNTASVPSDSRCEEEVVTGLPVAKELRSELGWN